MTDETCTPTSNERVSQALSGLRCMAIWLRSVQMRVLVCGGRYYNGDAPWNHVMKVLGDLHAETPITAIIVGGATGADCLGGCWADMYKVKCVTVPADWAKHGKAAGPIRNRRMLTDFKPDLVVAFPGGKGTANMIEQAEQAGVRVMRATESENEVSKRMP